MLVMNKNSHFLIVLLPCFLMSSYTSVQRINLKAVDEKQMPVRNYESNNIPSKNYSADRLFDINKHYISSNVKYYDYKKYDDQGNILLISPSGISGRFAWEDNCLVFIAINGFKATPLLPYGITQWDETSKTLTIENTSIKMGEFIDTNGTFSKNTLNREGICWNYPYVVSVGVMGGIKVFKSKEDLLFYKSGDYKTY